MAEKVHPRGDSPPPYPPYSPRTATPSESFRAPTPTQEPGPVGDPVNHRHRRSTSGLMMSPAGSFESSTGQRTEQPPPPGTYVVQLPKDQIFSYPPPENERKYEVLSGKKPRRSRCQLCLCYTLVALLIVIIAVGIAATVLYLVFRPEAPNYTVSEIAIRGMNLTSSTPLAPEFDVSIRADNDNRRLGIYYRPGSEINVMHGDVLLSTGTLPVFYQPSRNVTVFQTALKGSNIALSDAIRAELGDEQRQGNVPFRLDVKAPVKIKVGAVRTWTITVTVTCDVTVDGVNINSRIISRSCDYSVKL